jgi:hypothetical protein
MSQSGNKVRFALETKAPGLVRCLMRGRASLRFYDQWQSRRRYQKLLRQYHASLREAIPNLEQWEQAFYRFLQENPRSLPIFESFMRAPVQTLQRQTFDADNGPIVICVVKNDRKRLQAVVTHHRHLGCTHFAVLDNDSGDGTVEWLLQQPDCDVYQVLEPFQSQKKYGWINQIMARYGFGRWFLYVDSDEFLVYRECETRPLPELLAALEARGNDRLAAILLDMYSRGKLYAETADDTPLFQQYPYFDADTYRLSQSRRGPAVKGGPRDRLFAGSADDSPLLIKFPLFRLQPGLIFESAHYLFPYQMEAPLSAALLHFKFLPDDLNRHQVIAREGNFQGGSREYKRYLRAYAANTDLCFWYEGSVLYRDSSSLDRLGLIQNPFACETQPL